MKPDAIDLGPRQLSQGGPPLVIAEMSGNHNGDLGRARAIVEAAADCGADAIKLQTFLPRTLTIDSKRPEFYIQDPTSPWDGARLWDLYEEAHTPWEWHEPLFELARNRGLACLSSAFDQSSLEFLIELGVDGIKISSFECIHTPLVSSAAGTGKPLIISTGMATREEVDEAVDAAAAARADGRLVLLQCTSSYPADEHDADVVKVQDLRERYGCLTGLSDHCRGNYAAFAAVGLGAVVIEKHLTLARDDGGVDSSFSLEPAELTELVEGVRRAHASLGRTRYGPKGSEAASLLERPSLYVVDEMAPGDRFTEANIRAIRPAAGLAPRELPRVLGLRAATSIPAGTPLTWDHVEAGPTRHGTE